MPFKSLAQRAKFLKMLEEGKISQKTFDEWDKDTPKTLPNKVPVKRFTKVKQPRRAVQPLKPMKVEK